MRWPAWLTSIAVLLSISVCAGGQGSDQTPKPRFLVPGIGGAVPHRRKSTPAPIPATPHGKQPSVQTPPPFNPLLAHPLRGTPPAQITVPGPGPTLPALPSIPGLPGTGGDTFGALQAIRISPFIYGINVIWGENGGTSGWDRDGGARAHRLAQLLKSAGATATRIGISWADVERSRGKFDWAATDRFIRYVKQLGITPICVVAGTPDWAIDRPTEVAQLLRERELGELSALCPPEPRYDVDFGRFMFALASRYRGAIRHWELWSEPDGWGMPIVTRDSAGHPASVRAGGDARRYAGLLKQFAAGVRRSDPQSRIAIGGLRVQSTDFLQALYAAGAKAHFDALAVHPYRERDQIAFGWIDRCRELMAARGDDSKPIWITEWGWATNAQGAEGLSEAHQARLIREAFNGIRARPFITIATYHALSDWRTDEHNPESLVPMGLVTRAMGARPAFATFRESALNLPGRVARAYRRVNLSGAPPRSDSDGVRAAVAEIRVDAAHPGAAMPRVWEGYVHGSDAGGVTAFASALPSLQALGPNLIRFDPFPDPSTVKRGSIDWTYADQMVDLVARAGARPMMNLATMPSDLSAPSGNTRLPRAATEWSEFVTAVVKRYNGEQKRGIPYWELSNEPNSGDFEIPEWLRFYAVFARAVTAADPAAKVGGPAVNGFDFEWLKALIDYCGTQSVPLHFVTWHAYGQPPAEYARQATQLREYLSRYPSLKKAEVILGEWNLKAEQSPENDGLQAAAYALSVSEQLASAGPMRSLFYEVIDGVDPRAAGAPLTGRWGLLSAANRPKPVYHAFRMLSQIAGRRLAAESNDSDIHALATSTPEGVRVLAWSDPASVSGGEPLLDVPLRIQVDGLPWNGPSLLTEEVLASRDASPPSAHQMRIPAGDPEVSAVLPPHSAILLTIRPAASTKKASLEIALDAPSYVVYGGSRFTVSATYRNVSSTAIRSRAELQIDGARTGAQPGTPFVVSPGESRTESFTVTAPLTGAAETIRLRVHVREMEGLDAYSTVKLVSPIKLSVSPARADIPKPGALPDSAEGSAHFTATLENRSDSRLQVGIICGTFSETLALPPHKSQVVQVTAAPPQNRTGNYDVPIKVLLNQSIVASTDVLMAVPAVCKRAARPVKVDALLDEWPAASPVPAGSGSSGAAIEAQVHTLWDDQYFYIAAVVKDREHYQPFPPEEMLRADSIQIVLDSVRPGPSESTGAIPSYTSVGLARGPSGSVVYRFAGQGKAPGLLSNAHLAVRRDSERTIYEAAIPWTELSQLPHREGSLMGIGVRINDSDGQTRETLDSPGMADPPRPSRLLGLRLLK